MELISSPVKILLPTLPKVSGRSEEKLFHSTERLLLSWLHIFSCYFTKDLWDLTKVRIDSQTQKFAPKAVYGLEWQAWIHFRFPSLGLWKWRGNELSRSFGTQLSSPCSWAGLTLDPPALLLWALPLTQHWKPLGNREGGGVVGPACLKCYFFGGSIQQLMKFWGPPTSLIKRWLKLQFG